MTDYWHLYMLTPGTLVCGVPSVGGGCGFQKPCYLGKSHNFLLYHQSLISYSLAYPLVCQTLSNIPTRGETINFEIVPQMKY